MIGLNGALLGIERASGVGTASGVWTLNEHGLYQREDKWIGDADFGSVSLLLHMNGSNGSTAFSDSSKRGLAVTANGNAQISTAQSKFGGTSAYFDGIGGYIQCSTSNTALSFGTNALTIEMWIYFNTVTANQVLYETGQLGGSGTRANGFVWYLTSAGRLELSSNGANRGASTGTITSGVWSHIALVRSGGVFRYYVNGTQDATSITLGSNFTDDLFLMGRLIDSPAFYLNAYVDDLRITKGVARYTANFTPPVTPFPNA